ncbi:uncharacterized protein LOC133953629 [Platichthys flesus]|uniref:uncharacterized protein LOC133953629 n=1 Tax=Platichthys flesus TaxID=8260 RepID=UPI002DB91C8D|nr:uncharacterized protein LOC133953629 [Platichthys flesus]XP_062243632.1 uncharacterized protein LOC133953629 [Platichthys flesus]
MAKGKGKTNSSGSRAQLRSRKRDRSGDEIPQTDDVQAPLKQQNTKEDSTSVVATPQLPQCLLQVCAIITHQQDQAAEKPCLTKQDESKEDQLSEKPNTCLKDVTVKTFEGQQESSVITSSELEGCMVHSNNDTNKSGIEEESPQDNIRPPPPTGSDQPQVFLPTSEEGDGSGAATLEKQLDPKETSQGDLAKNHETSQEDTCTLSMADVKEITKEAAVGLRTKKKRRMGMCGLTEKERSHFLLAQKRENEQGGVEEVERQICSNAADPGTQERIISSLFGPSSLLSIPVDGIAEQNPAETLKSCRCGVNNRAETEVHVAVTTSDGFSPACDPGSSEVKSCEAERGTEPGPEQTGEPESCHQEKQELEEGKTVITTETPEKQSTDGEDKSTEAGGCAAMGSYLNPAENEESEKKKATAGLQVQRETETSDELEEEMMVDGSDGSEEEGISSTITGPGGFNCGSVELSEAAVTPPGKKDCHDLKYELAPTTVTTGHTRTRDPTEVIASGGLDYVSDSQLNTIVLIDEEVKQREKTFGSSDNPGDATDLICGLIRELSSLNQKVMATHRELENLQRGSKASKSSLH